ncbi:Sed1p TDEL_0B04090 [Torulaspora delbrueckii]|uniref:Cell wall protein SED1 n=1 Tax=Torulaspora delbrueckii TaxID=4950 RepID=G8ZPJ4_TORDE|nr:hypothetical protein TDEL_0B04090 [Torulaspora delbrueckii]CCE90538.1 hypothetical protein TDEL_0B04090 [Torulaspora delbrueckii]
MLLNQIFAAGMMSAVALGAQFLNSTSASTSTAVVTETTVVSEFTTYCPYPTTIVTNNATYTVTEATTLTITDCPCTLTTTKPATKFTTETTVVSEFTTYCPYPTTIVTNGQSYTVTEPTTLTITDCPCWMTTVKPAPQEPTTTGVTTGAPGTSTVEPSSTHDISTIVNGGNMMVPSLLGVAGIAMMLL